MIPGAFTYHRPTSLDEAAGLLAQHAESRVLAGGHSLIPMMKLRLAVPEHLVDLQAVAELKGIEESGGSLLIGAMTSQQAVIASEVLAKRCPILRETALQIADPQVRACGTLGGNLANGDPGNDMPAVMLALEARFHLQGKGGKRTVAARQFYEGSFVTAAKEGEILTRIEIPAPPPGHGYAYEKQKRKVGDYATAAAAVLLTLDSGRCKSAAIALTNVGDTPLLAEAAANSLIGQAPDAAAGQRAAALAMEIAQPASDGRGPADYRKHVAGVMVRRAIEKAAQRAAAK